MFNIYKAYTYSLNFLFIGKIIRNLPRGLKKYLSPLTSFIKVRPRILLLIYMSHTIKIIQT